MVFSEGARSARRHEKEENGGMGGKYDGEDRDIDGYMDEVGKMRRFK